MWTRALQVRSVCKQIVGVRFLLWTAGLSGGLAGTERDRPAATKILGGGGGRWPAGRADGGATVAPLRLQERPAAQTGRNRGGGGRGGACTILLTIISFGPALVADGASTETASANGLGPERADRRRTAAEPSGRCGLNGTLVCMRHERSAAGAQAVRLHDTPIKGEHKSSARILHARPYVSRSDESVVNVIS